MTTAYKINVALNLITNSSSFSRTMSHELGIVETSAVRLRGVLGGLVLGVGLIEGVKAVSRVTSDYADEVQKLQTILRTPANMQAADAIARRVSLNVPTTNYTDNYKAIGDLTPAFGRMPNEQEVESLQKLSAVIEDFGGRAGQAFDIAKGLETRGAANSPERFRRESAEMVQAIEATHGRVDATQFLDFIRKGNPFSTGFSDQFLYKIAPTLITDMKGAPAGAALTTFENTLVGGRMTKAAKDIFQRIGLLDPHARFGESSAGGVQLTGSRVRGSDIAMSDPNRWITEILAPAMTAHGFRTQKQQEELIAKLFSNRNSERIAVEFLVNSNRYAKDSAVITGTENPFSTYARMAQNNPAMLWKENMKQFDNVMIDLGNVLMPVVVPAMRELVQWLQATAYIIHSGFGVGGLFNNVADKIKVTADTGSSYADKWHNALHFLGLGGNDKSAVPPGNKSAMSMPTGNIYMDATKVGNVVWHAANKRMSLPNNNTSSPDPRMSYVPNN